MLDLPPVPVERHWKLESGKSVNDMLKNDVAGDLARLRILDATPGGPTRERQEYTEAEWNEIVRFVDLGLTDPIIPSLPESSLEELKARGIDLVINPVDAFPALGLALLDLARKYAGGVLRKSHNERAYDSFWEQLLTGAFDTTNLYLARGESTSVSIKDLINNGRTVGTSLFSGPKFDAIILSNNTEKGVKRIEYGLLEVSKSPQKPYNAKYINDHEKILKGMIASMMNEGGNLRVSIMCLGLELIITYMKRHESGLYVLHSRQVVRLPLEYSGEAVRLVAKEIAMLRLILKRVEESMSQLN